MQGVSKRALQWDSECYLNNEIVCTPLDVNIFLTLVIVKLFLKHPVDYKGFRICDCLTDGI
jgi:hypothetical protein